MDIAVRRRPQDRHYTYNSKTVIAFLTLEFPLWGSIWGKTDAAAFGSDTGTTQIGSTRLIQK